MCFPQRVVEQEYRCNLDNTVFGGQRHSPLSAVSDLIQIESERKDLTSTALSAPSTPHEV
jgi:hypothetical protein